METNKVRKTININVEEKDWFSFKQLIIDNETTITAVVEKLVKNINNKTIKKICINNSI